MTILTEVQQVCYKTKSDIEAFWQDQVGRGQKMLSFVDFIKAVFFVTRTLRLFQDSMLGSSLERTVTYF